MADVKISELPALANVNDNNVVIVNDSVTNTTSKATLWDLNHTIHTVTFNCPNGCTMTVNGESAQTGTLRVTVLAPGIGYAESTGRISVTNPTSDPIPCVFQFTTLFCGYTNPISPILTEAGGVGGGSPLYSAFSTLESVSTMRILTPTTQNRGLYTLDIPANTTVNFNYINITALILLPKNPQFTT